MDWRARLGAEATLVIIVGLLIAYMWIGPGQKVQINVNGKDRSGSVILNNRDLSFLEIFDQLFKDERTQGITRVLLREERHFFELRDPTLVDAIAQLGYDDPIAKKFRDLQIGGKGPFQVRETRIRVGFPSGHRFAKGYAAVCQDSPMRNARLLLRSDAGVQLIPVVASGFFPCDGNNAGDGNSPPQPPLVLITKADAITVYGQRPLRNTEDGWAFVMPPDPIAVELPTNVQS